MRVRDDVGEPVEPLERLVHVVDVQVEEGCRGIAVQQQPHAVEVEEEQSRRSNRADRLGLEQHRVEVRGTAEVFGVLRDLTGVSCSSSKCR